MAVFLFNQFNQLINEPDESTRVTSDHQQPISNPSWTIYNYSLIFAIRKYSCISKSRQNVFIFTIKKFNASEFPLK